MIIIGEKINASRKSISKAILNHDDSSIKEQIEKQDKAGAHYIDLNAGAGSGDEQKEIDDMCWLIDIALGTTDKKLSIDSANPSIIEKAVEHLDGRRPFLINSVKNDPDILNQLLPLVSEYKVPVICLAMDAQGIPENAKKRTEVCLQIYKEAKKAGIVDENLIFDALIMPLSANYHHGKIALDTLQNIKKELPKTKTTIGVSNISFGLPQRSLINEALLITAINLGVDVVICDPTNKGVRKGFLLGNLIAGKDRYCRKFTRALRKGEIGTKKKKK